MDVQMLHLVRLQSRFETSICKVNDLMSIQDLSTHWAVEYPWWTNFDGNDLVAAHGNDLL